MAIPGFWSCGFIPRPSAGTNDRRSNGLALKQVVAMKNTRMAASVPHAQGARSRALRCADRTATALYSARMSDQNSIEPACPPQNAANTYTFGMFALVFDATYLSEKSCVSSAVHRPRDASTIISVVAYRPRRPLVTRSSRPSAPPAYDVTQAQAA